MYSPSPLSLARTHAAPLFAADSPTAIDGKYVVVLNEHLSDDDGMPPPHNDVFVDNISYAYTYGKGVLSNFGVCVCV